MIDSAALVSDAKRLAAELVDDLRGRTDEDEASRDGARGVFSQAVAAGRTDKTYEEWREDLLAQVAAGWVLASVFVRFCEDNGLVDDPLLSGPGARLDVARDHRADFLAQHPTAGDREWLEHVYRRYQRIPAVAEIFGERNPLWQLAPSADGARAILDLWWAQDDEGREIRHDFTDPKLGTRFLGDLYQDLSEHARKQYALLQTPDFIESFILDRTLDPSIDTFGLDEVKMIDPTCGSGHFLLGAFHRLLERWREREPGTDARALAQRALDAVHGVDVNPFAVEIARFRLLVAALRAASLRRLEDLPAFDLNLAVGDSLLHGVREGGFLSGTTGVTDAVRHHYVTEDADEVERILEVDGYHAVVGNPPYITVKDGALNRAYRGLYDTCHRQYSLAVPFMERFFQLAAHGSTARQAGFVGMITANSFMKREFGTKLIEEFLPRVDLTHVIDTSGAYIPGHGTPTVILFGRDQKPADGSVRAVLGIRGEPGRPDNPANGLVWSSIRDLINKPGAENDYVSIDDIDRARYQSHPWSLQGGAAPRVAAAIDTAASLVIEDVMGTSGFASFPGNDDCFIATLGAHRRAGIDESLLHSFVTGDVVRDWGVSSRESAFVPVDDNFELLGWPGDVEGWPRFLWRNRHVLSSVKTFGNKTRAEVGDDWWGWYRWLPQRYRVRFSIVFAEVATHNHFVLDRGGKIFKQTAPVIKLPEGAGEDEHLELLGLLNCSVGEFWQKQVFHSKGVGGIGGGIGDEEWEPRYARDSTKLKQFPLPDGRPLRWARALDDTAQQLADVLPAAVAERDAPTREALDDAREKAATQRAWMVALQEELDWRCYQLYGLIDEDLTYDLARLPTLQLGERAFEIALARRMASGEESSTWFERHGSTPTTELPASWPDDYRELVERRLALIDGDRGIGLLERPEYKRRWNWDDLADLERDAQRTWLLDRIEDLLKPDADKPAVTTCARLADRLAEDTDAVAVAQDLGGPGTDLVALVTDLVESAAVPYLAAWRLKDSGLRTRAAWERTWDLQRIEDAIDARIALPEDHPDHLPETERDRERKRQGVDAIPVPPKYKSSDFRSTTAWRLRGKLDVPKEQFILYPATRTGADATPVVGWAGWDHLGQAKALAGHLLARRADGAEVDELMPLLAGVAELVPWLLQWHDEPDPVYGERMGQYFDAFVVTEAAALGITVNDLHVWGPPPTTRGRRRKATNRS